LFYSPANAGRRFAGAPKGVIYLNRSAPGRLNPVDRNWYVGGRWQRFAPFYGGNLNTHACCRNHLLYHAVWDNCT